MGNYKIVTFDGGGIRGVISISIIIKLMEKYPNLLKDVDIFAGTSTGAIIALGLAMGLEPQEILNLYLEKGKYIFSNRYLEFFRPKYDNAHLYQALSSIFHHYKLMDLKKYVVVPTFKLRNGEDRGWSPVFFNNFPDSKTKHFRVLDVAMASSAAPVYFPSYQSYVDGSIVTNNPSMSALVAALDKKKGNQKLKDIRLLSIGTGFIKKEIVEDTTKWGLFEWQLNAKIGLPLEMAMLDASVLANDYYCSKLLHEKYLRINPKLEKNISLDDYKDIPHMISLVEEMDFDRSYRWIEKYWIKGQSINRVINTFKEQKSLLKIYRNNRKQGGPF